MMNFVCVLRKDAPTKKSPGFYDKEWVNKLHRAIQRNYDKPFKFFCLSNVQTDVETIPLITNWKGWWSKIELFRPNLFQGPVTYIDLDIVICNNITSLIDKLDSTKFWMVEEPGNIVNSSIMHWQGDYSHLYKKLSTDQEAIQNKFKKFKIWCAASTHNKEESVIGKLHKNLKKKHNLFIMEDCCASVGAKFGDGKNIGTVGDMSSYSFYFGHQLSTIEGGMISTNSKQIDILAKMKRGHGLLRDSQDPKLIKKDASGVYDLSAIKLNTRFAIDTIHQMI